MAADRGQPAPACASPVGGTALVARQYGASAVQPRLATSSKRCPWQPIGQWPCQFRPPRDAENDRTDRRYVSVPSVLTTQRDRPCIYGSGAQEFESFSPHLAD